MGLEECRIDQEIGKMDYDLIIIGTGIIGSSIVYNLVNDGFEAKKILAVDKGMPAQGSTSLSAGGFRNLWTTEVNVKMCNYSIKQYESLQKETDIGFNRAGYLFLKNKKQWKQSKKLAEEQKKQGIRIEVLGSKEIKKMIPKLDLELKHLEKEIKEFFCLEDIVGGIYGVDCGFIEPYRLSTEMLSKAQKEGVTVMTHSEVIDILKKENQISGIKIKNNKIISAGIVVNAAGPYSAKICKMLDMTIPTQPINRQIFVTYNPFENFRIPMLILDNGAYVRNEMDDLLFGRANEDETGAKEIDGEYVTHCSRSYYLDEIYPYFLARLPGLDKGARVKAKWGGFYDVNYLDHNSIIGQHPDIKGFYMAVGFSGHGIMQAAAAGKCISELIMKDKLITLPEARQLRFERFKENDLVSELQVI